jgi:hypothetical protein
VGRIESEEEYDLEAEGAGWEGMKGRKKSHNLEAEGAEWEGMEGRKKTICLRGGGRCLRG